jgi:hypothetical protein
LRRSYIRVAGLAHSRFQSQSLMPHEPGKARDKQQHDNNGSKSTSGQIRNVTIGFAPALWVLSRHLDGLLHGKWPA